MDLFTTAVSTAVARLSERAVDDTYQKLKVLVKKKWGKNNNLAKAIEELEQNPTSLGRRATLEEEVACVSADKDPDILVLVNQIQKLCSTPGGQFPYINMPKKNSVDTNGKGNTVAVDGSTIINNKGMGLWAWLLIIIVFLGCLWGIFRIVQSLQEKINISQSSNQLIGTWEEQGELLAATRKWTFYDNGEFLFSAILAEEKGTWVVSSKNQINLHITESDTLINSKPRDISCQFEIYDDQLILNCADSKPTKPIYLRKLH